MVPREGGRQVDGGREGGGGGGGGGCRIGGRTRRAVEQHSLDVTDSEPLHHISREHA